MRLFVQRDGIGFGSSETGDTGADPHIFVSVGVIRTLVASKGPQTATALVQIFSTCRQVGQKNQRLQLHGEIQVQRGWHSAWHSPHLPLFATALTPSCCFGPFRACAGIQLQCIPESQLLMFSIVQLSNWESPISRNGWPQIPHPSFDGKFYGRKIKLPFAGIYPGCNVPFIISKTNKPHTQGHANLLG